ncbi:unnamed protein product [Porites lobata]|uniref:Uncharacterized protein n=1 Tax=Porites lobata TaxID=104759 RepID=A0ABN8Q4V0_9CNID|nr:unnamed protein product [Porites lobata]
MSERKRVQWAVTQLVQISTHLKRPRPKIAKARVFCLLHEEVSTNI